jgi:hypothetical protein
MAGRGVMTVEPQDFFITNFDTESGAAAAFPLDLQKA